MKKTISMLVGIMIFASSIRSQCALQVSAPCINTCAKGTFIIGQAHCVSGLMTATGADTYTWTLNGFQLATGSTYSYNIEQAGEYKYIVYGQCIGGAMVQAAVTVRVSNCPNGEPEIDEPVGIPEYSAGNKQPLYFDLYGNAVQPQPGKILIERRGNIRRKVVFE